MLFESGGPRWHLTQIQAQDSDKPETVGKWCVVRLKNERCVGWLGTDGRFNAHRIMSFPPHSMALFETEALAKEGLQKFEEWKSVEAKKTIEDREIRGNCRHCSALVARIKELKNVKASS